MATKVSKRHPQSSVPQSPSPITKITDQKGRVLLGGKFANRSVIIESISETEVVIKLARVIPESEAWLYENPTALQMVRTGLEQARSGNISSEGSATPNLNADASFADKLEG